MGVWEVATHLGTILGNLKKCWEEIEAFKPDAIVLVDFPGFNMRIARKAANAKWGDVKIFQVVAPQVWAWKKRRIKNLARDYTAVFPVLPFEHNLLIAGGVQSIYCGHPLLDALSTNQDETTHAPPSLSSHSYPAHGSKNSIKCCLYFLKSQSYSLRWRL